MSIFTQKASSQKEFDLAPAGAHAGCLIAIIDLGTHTETFQGSDPRDCRKVFMLWEIDHIPEGSKSGRCVIGREYNLSFSAKSGLRIMIEKWRGKSFAEGEDFDLTKLIGQPCLVTVTHTVNGDRTFAKIDAIGPMPKGMKGIKPSRPTITFDLQSGEPFPEADYLPWSFGKPLAQKFDECHERRGGRPASPQAAASANGHAASAAADTSDEPLPF